MINAKFALIVGVLFTMLAPVYAQSSNATCDKWGEKIAEKFKAAGPNVSYQLSGVPAIYRAYSTYAPVYEIRRRTSVEVETEQLDAIPYYSINNGIGCDGSSKKYDQEVKISLDQLNSDGNNLLVVEHDDHTWIFLKDQSSSFRELSHNFEGSLICRGLGDFSQGTKALICKYERMRHKHFTCFAVDKKSSRLCDLNK